MMNLQVFHQVLTVLGAVCAGLGAVLIFAGCTVTAAGGYDCAANSWEAGWAPWLAGAGALIVLVKPFVTMAQGGPEALVRPIVVLPKRDRYGQFKSE